MSLLKSILRYSLAGLAWSALLVAGVAQAERERAPGYVTDSSGNIVRGTRGECLRSSDWTPNRAVVVGCDGVVLSAPVKTRKGGPTGHNVAFIIPAATMFAFDSAELTEQGAKDLATYRDKITPELAQAFAVVIIGHTDNVGTPEYNLGLSKRRADSVRDFLIAGGAPPKILRTVGMGLDEPLVSNDTEEGRAKNRRVEVIVFGEVRFLDVMKFPSVALFPRLSSELTPRGRELLDENIAKGTESLSRAVYVEVIGHTDDVGDAKANQELSEERARTVRDKLVKAGVHPSEIMAVGAGSSRPIASNQTEEGREQNRRVEVLVLGRLKQ